MDEKDAGGWLGKSAEKTKSAGKAKISGKEKKSDWFLSTRAEPMGADGVGVLVRFSVTLTKYTPLPSTLHRLVPWLFK